MLIESIELREARDDDERSWADSLAMAKSLQTQKLEFRSPIIVICGANGSGKSTLVEAIADAAGMDVRGGHGNRTKGLARPQDVPLGPRMTIRGTLGLSLKRKGNDGFFLRAETAAGMLAFMTDHGVAGYGGSSKAISRGEGYLQAINGRLNNPGLYLLDEADTPLSFESTLALMYKLQDLAKRPNTTIICATHSPVLAGIDGAQVFELSDDGITETSWEDLKMVHLWRSFLENPKRFSQR